MSPGSGHRNGPHRPRRRQFGHLPGGKVPRHPHQLCIVSNPENTAIFRQLGVTAAISATATLAQAIRGGSGGFPDPVGAKARAATAAAVAAAGPATAKGRRRWHPQTTRRPRCPSPFRSILGSWHPGKSAGDRHGKDARRQPCAGHRPGRAGRRRSGPGPARALGGRGRHVRRPGGASTPGGAAGLPDEVALAPCFIFPGISAAMAGYLVYFASPDPAPGARLPAGRPPRTQCWSGFSPSPSTRCPTWPRGCSPPSGRLRVHQRADHHGLKRGGRGRLPGHLPVPPPPHLLPRRCGARLILTCVVTQTGGLGVYNAEATPTTCCRAPPKAARMILLIYSGLIIAGAVAYWAAGMTPFDAINISMRRAHRRVRHPRRGSIAYWNSPVIRPSPSCSWWPAARTSFCCSCCCAASSRRSSPISRRRCTSGTIAVMALVVAGFFLGQGVSGDGAEALRQGTFQVVSILSLHGVSDHPSFADLGPALLFPVRPAHARRGRGALHLRRYQKLYRVAVASLGLGHDLHERYGNKRHVTTSGSTVSGSGRCSPRWTWPRPRPRGAVPAAVRGRYVRAHTLRSHPTGGGVRLHLVPQRSTGVGTGFLGAESGPAPLLIRTPGCFWRRLEFIPCSWGWAPWRR